MSGRDKGFRRIDEVVADLMRQLELRVADEAGADTPPADAQAVASQPREGKGKVAEPGSPAKFREGHARQTERRTALLPARRQENGHSIAAIEAPPASAVPSLLLVNVPGLHRTPPRQGAVSPSMRAGGDSNDSPRYEFAGRGNTEVSRPLARQDAALLELVHDVSTV